MTHNLTKYVLESWSKDTYQEEDGGTFTHNGIDYDINLIFKLTEHSKVVKFKVKDLKWVLEYDNPDPVRVDKADLSAPILVHKLGNELVAVDGLHRLAKAVRDGVETLPGKWVTDEMLKQAQVG